MYFDELNLEDDILDALDAMNFVECTPVQEHTIPPLLEGHDLIGVAQTGTGKTAAFLLPVLNQLSKGEYPQDAINCIIMSPTRELAQQIDQQMEAFSYFTNSSSVAVYGGNDGIRFAQEQKGLTLGADVVIATPGRLLAHINMGYVDLSRVSFFILDEADRMLDMGFSDDIMQIAKLMPETRQTIMFSATMPEKIRQLARTILKNPVEVKLAVSKPAEKIQQSAYICHEPQKLGIIQHMFKDEPAKRVIIFASSKLKVKEVTKALQRMKLNVGEMHSDLDQAQRDAVMHEFKNDRVDILVATDIVSRGIDIDDITMVINFDVPHDCEDYVHRIGRTARAGNEGRAITFVGPREQTRFHSIEEFIEREVEKLLVPESLGEVPEYRPDKKNEGKRRGRKGEKSSNRGRGKAKKSNGHEKRKATAGNALEQSTNKEAEQPHAQTEKSNTGGAKKKRSHRGGRNRHKDKGGTLKKEETKDAE